MAIVEYANGVRATFHTNCNAGIPERRMYILGSEGAIRADVLTGKIEYRRIGFSEQIIDASTTAAGGHGDGDTYLTRELVRSMTKGIAPHAGIEEGLRSAITCFGIDKAMETGKMVDIRPMWEKVGIGL